MDQLALVTQVVVQETPAVTGGLEEMSMQIDEAIIGQVTNIEETGFVGKRPTEKTSRKARSRSAPDVGVRVGSFSIAFLRRSEFRTRSRSRTELGVLVSVVSVYPINSDIVIILRRPYDKTSKSCRGDTIIYAGTIYQN